MSVQVSLMEVGDIIPLTYLAEMMHEESVFAHIPFNKDKVMQLGLDAIYSANYIALSAKQHDKHIGFFIGYYTTHFFSDERVAMDMTLFVHPDNRGSWAAIKMLRWFLNWAKEMDCKSVQLGTVTQVTPERTIALFKRKLGLSVLGTVLTKGL